MVRGAATLADLDQFIAKRDVARNRVISAEEVIQQTRVGLGLPINHENPLDLPFVITVEPTSEQSIRDALAEMLKYDFLVEPPLAMPMEKSL